MFAAITAAQNGASVLLLERNDRLGKKLLITGKGRCNVTNHCTSQEILQNIPRNSRFLYSAMSSFSPKDIMAFLEENGCPLKTERGNRVFPVSDRSASVLDTLERAMHHAGVTVQKARVRAILMENGKAGDTPAAVLSGGNAPNPACIRGTLETISKLAKDAQPPAIILVGPVAGALER